MKKDLAGIRFGKLMAIEPTDKKSGSNVVWKCVCDCGNEVYVSGNSLGRGKTRSCGCLVRRNLTGKRFGKLIAVEPTQRRYQRCIIWKCWCDCGNYTYVKSTELSYGHKKSCGCLHSLYGGDLSGRRFGKLFVVEPTKRRKNGKIVWKCICDCGKDAYVPTDSLTSGNTKSCGCLMSENLVGQVFGRLTVVRKAEGLRYYGCFVWECQCSCGNTAFASTGNLKRGSVRSCGCLRDDYVKFGRLGADNPRWCGGISFEPYSCAFNERLKEEIRKRDGYECQICGKSQKDNNQKLSVHHIDYDKENCDLNNLVTTCLSCNSKANVNRSRWLLLFTILRELRFNHKSD